MQQINRRAPPAPLELPTLSPPAAHTTRLSPRRPPPTLPPSTPLPALPTPPYSPRSPPTCYRDIRRVVTSPPMPMPMPIERSPSRSSSAPPSSNSHYRGYSPAATHVPLPRCEEVPDNVLDEATLAPLRYRRRAINSRRYLAAQQEPWAALPLKFKEDNHVEEPDVHPFARNAHLYAEGESLASPTASTYSVTTSAISSEHQRVDARITELEDQLRALQERLAEKDAKDEKDDPKLREAKSMPFLRRLGRRGDKPAKEKEKNKDKGKEERETQGYIALVEARSNEGEEAKVPKTDKSDMASVVKSNLGDSSTSVIDLSHLDEGKENKRWKPFSGKSKQEARPTTNTQGARPTPNLPSLMTYGGFVV